ncbi:hypothetical protein MAR_026432 [Mya arenaria]|uniref:EGF-like domain-containing protein n=1 Tax=Mya arenaria TaxID=6604 RepID=A0ABY7ETL3_MYAAR|nr:hypothetical protein MAR_026432 [Mya arenaria]
MTPQEKGAGSECNPSEDTCTQFSRCVFKLGENRYTCTCEDDFTVEGTACKSNAMFLLPPPLPAVGEYLANPDFNSHWTEIAAGFRPDKDIQEGSCDPVSSPAVYIYDDTHINVSVSTYKQLEIAPVKKTDSFYEVSHGLGEYPGLVIMRALLETNGRTFRADGVGSSMNVFYRVDRFNNAYLVYGFNDENFRVWVDASPSGGSAK